jgi:YtxH-like protein
VNKFFRSLLKTGLCLLELSDRATDDMRDRAEDLRDRAADIRDRAKDQVEDLAGRTRRAMRGQQTPTLRGAISFAVGVGLGVGVGMLFAPASGQETRSSISDTFQDVGNRVRERFSAAERAAG